MNRDAADDVIRIVQPAESTLFPAGDLALDIEATRRRDRRPFETLGKKLLTTTRRYRQDPCHRALIVHHKQHLPSQIDLDVRRSCFKGLGPARPHDRRPLEPCEFAGAWASRDFLKGDERVSRGFIWLAVDGSRPIAEIRESLLDVTYLVAVERISPGRRLAR